MERKEKRMRKRMNIKFDRMWQVDTRNGREGSNCIKMGKKQKGLQKKMNK
jgi:hypothetical protein